MSILVCKNLEIEVAGSKLLDNISFKLEQGEKAGLVGPNGSGKTTLLRAIVGELPYQAGEVILTASMGYLPQTAKIDENLGSVFEAMLTERKDILDMRSKLRYLELRMAEINDDKALEQYSTLTEKYELNGGYALEAGIRKILSGLGLEHEQNKAISFLSGGQKTRLALGKILLREPELLILDEPTNHLDIEALEWLENYLAAYNGAVLVVSHDRYFLDNIAEKILHIQDGGLSDYRGNYSEYELQRTIEQKTLSREAERMNKKIADLEEYVRKYGAGIKAKQARGREIQLNRLNRIDVPKDSQSLKLNFGRQVRTGDKVMNITDLAVEYDQKRIFEGVSLELSRGDRIALLGKNGVGKTSLLKAIGGSIAYKGEIKIGSNVIIGYYSQEHENIGNRDNIIDEIRYSSTLDDPEIRNLLARFGFRGEDVFKQIKVLSGGEKSRLALCKLFLSKGNFLLLDEPTNHLDMQTREVLEEALRDYEGTIVTVSHDRYFLNKTVDKIAMLTPHGLKIFDGDYTTYREHLESELKDDNREKSAELEDSPTARNYHEESKNNRRKEQKVEKLEQRIHELESLLKEIEHKLELVMDDYEEALRLQHEQETVQQELEVQMAEWLELIE